MAEPVKLHKNGEVQTIVAPSVMNDMIADGWSTDEPEVVTVEPEVEAPKPALKKRGRPPKAKS